MENPRGGVAKNVSLGKLQPVKRARQGFPSLMVLTSATKHPGLDVDLCHVMFALLGFGLALVLVLSLTP